MYTFDELFGQCKENYCNKEACCHQERQEVCDCSVCLQKQFRAEGTDYYECKNKLNCYVLNYGACYISEIYYYLSTSGLLNNFNNSINILSLGCGFAPDYFAFDKFIKDKNLNLRFNYHGMDNSEVWKYISWKELPSNTDNPATFYTRDLTEQNINLKFYDYDIIFLSKIYSTIRRNKANTTNFLNNIVKNVQNMKTNSVLIFHDINSIWEGRDEFDSIVRNEFKGQNINNFYTGKKNWNIPANWKKIDDFNIIYQNLQLEDNVHKYVKKTIFFEYWKK